MDTTGLEGPIPAELFNLPQIQTVYVLYIHVHMCACVCLLSICAFAVPFCFLRSDLPTVRLDYGLLW